MRTQKYIHEFSQRIACKYLVVKLIDKHTYQEWLEENGGIEYGYIAENRMDMFQLNFEGYQMAIPDPQEYRRKDYKFLASCEPVINKE